MVNKLTESCNAVVADIQAGLITEAAINKVEEELRKYEVDVGSDLIKDAKSSFQYIIDNGIYRVIVYCQ